MPPPRDSIWKTMPRCSATDAFEIGRVPRCCPGCALIPNQVGSLSPSRAFFIEPTAGKKSPKPPTFTPYSGRSSEPLVPTVDSMINEKWCGVRVMLPTGEIAPVLQTGSRL